jgi:PadR family transcriptional regulator PadR
MYGYELVQAVRDATGDAIVLAEGVVYPVLHMLEREGALAARRQTVNGRSRVYYRLTPRGALRLGDLSSAWHKLNTIIANVLQEHRHA